MSLVSRSGKWTFAAALWSAALSALIGGLAPAAHSAAPDVAGKIAISPAQMTLTARRQPHSILVLAEGTQGLSVDLTSEAKFASADESIARVDLLGWVTPVATGQTTVTVSAAGQTATVAVAVKLPETERPYSFRDEVMPVLSKGGCNQGACHGYSLGKNGFKLSLRGSDPPDDYLAITQEFFGRRINPHHPQASLLVGKPVGDVPHNGGVRFDRGSLLNEILVSWIGQGAPGDLNNKVTFQALRIVPEKIVLAPGAQHQLQLIATYSDGSERDVTRLGIFTSNVERIAGVEDDGLVSALELGETAIVARFERKFVATGVIVLSPKPGFEPTPVPEDHLIDKFVIQKLNDLKIKPSELAGDTEFLRRVYIDLIGLAPKPDEVRAFVADKDPNKRLKTIDALLARPEFVDRWSLKWGDLLQNSRTRLTESAMYAFREWIRAAVAQNMPLDELARKVLTGLGGPEDDPTSAYYVISADPEDTLQRATAVFCGVQMLCAKCHPHPLENWTQADYYGLASFFNQVTTKPDPHQDKVANAKLVLLTPAAPYARNPRSGLLQPPRYLGGAEPKIAKDADRREVYAQWLTSPDNPFFARSMTNRIWSYFFHRGIIDPVDDLRTTNPPINPQLLDALTKDFVEHKFDVRHLMRRIVTSRTYQTSSLANETNVHDDANFSHAIPRRLQAEVMLDSLVQATGVPEAISGAPAGFTAAQLPDGNVNSEFLSLFGKPQRMVACECERDDSSNMLQALNFINGKSILSRVSDARGRVAQLLKQKLTDEQLVEELYLWSLARFPRPEETKLALDFLASYGEQRPEAVQDLMWGLLNSRDFMLVH